MAITGLVLGCISLATLGCGPYAILTLPLHLSAVITSHIARANLHKQNPPMGGQGLALAGMIMGYVCLGLSLLMGLVVAIFFGFAFAMSQASAGGAP